MPPDRMHRIIKGYFVGAMMILDPACGSKMFWFDKDNSSVIFGDIRVCRSLKYHKSRNPLDVVPDVQMSFAAIPFPSDFFEMVVFDPPHLVDVGLNSWLAKKYGKLFANWRDEIHSGFEECFRVLKPGGSLIFKWNEYDVPLSEVLELAPARPLFGHASGKSSKTHWLCFVKIDR